MFGADTPSKCLGGWQLPTRRYKVLAAIPGNKFPPVGTICSVWPWGPIIHRIDETGRHIELGDLNTLEAEGKLKLLPLYAKAKPKAVLAKEAA